MSKKEVENLSDSDLINNWEQIKAMFKAGVQQNLTPKQGLILFADFVNISSEMHKRQIET